MDTLTAEQAAQLLHIHPKSVQAMARAGRLPATRVGRKWLFHRADLQRLLGRPTAPLATEGLESLSARNQLHATVEAIRVDGVMAEVALRVGDQALISIITRSSAERLGLAIGDHVFAVFKSTEVMVAKPRS